MTVRIGLKHNYTNNEAGNTWDDSMTSLKEGTRQIWASQVAKHRARYRGSFNSLMTNQVIRLYHKDIQMANQY